MEQQENAGCASTARLTDSARAALQGYVARATWPAGFQIYERGTPADGVFIVERGRVILRSRVRAGRSFVPWVATPGETFGAEGLSPASVYVTDARADEETETLFLGSSQLRAFLREQPIHALAVVSQVVSERTTLLEKLRELTTLSVEQRIVTALRRMVAHDSFLQNDGRIELNTSRYRLLCELVGATRESVSLVLGRLGAEGLVQREGSTLYVTPSARLFERIDGGGDDVLLVSTLSDLNSGETALQ